MLPSKLTQFIYIQTKVSTSKRKLRSLLMTSHIPENARCMQKKGTRLGITSCFWAWFPLSCV